MKVVAVFLSLALAGAVHAQSKLTAVDEAGYPKLVSGYKGKVLLVDFWATWCKPCRAEMPELAKLSKRLAARGFALVTVSSDEPEQETAAANVLKNDGITGAAYIKKPKDDDKFINAIDPKWGGALPALFLYDRTGKKIRSFIGETPTKELEAAIEKLL
jgi:thiol-disulfide isomerase/thioredoxin